MNDVEKLTMTVPELAEALGISKDYAYALAHHEKFTPAIYLGKRILISRPAFMKWIEEANFNIDVSL